MTDSVAITVDLPQEVYERVQQIAHLRQISLEDVLLDTLVTHLVTPSVEDQLAMMETLSDTQLWEIVKQPPSEKAARLAQLIEQHEESSLTDQEKAELDELVDWEDDRILRHSNALVLLQERGYDVIAYLKSGR